ncbi:MAG: histidine phosphatase family protein [Kutzneria sp.]|nr:histidine phosphatase family protein [Kutzneria sp.]MBV9846041.1 histidine phosphatase family protein [Kutzneria sp.]
MATVNRLFLISHGATIALRGARFPADEPLDAAPEHRREPALRVDMARHGPESRCVQTAVALGLVSAVEPALADLDCGTWRGRSLTEVERDDPSDVAEWLTDPDAAPHGGESVRQLLDRVAGWLDGLPATGRLAAVTSPAVVRAVVVRVLSAPAEAFWRIDVPPLTVTHVFGVPGRWTLRCQAAPVPGWTVRSK